MPQQYVPIAGERDVESGFAPLLVTGSGSTPGAQYGSVPIANLPEKQQQSGMQFACLVSCHFFTAGAMLAPALFGMLMTDLVVSPFISNILVRGSIDALMFYAAFEGKRRLVLSFNKPAFLALADLDVKQTLKNFCYPRNWVFAEVLNVLFTINVSALLGFLCNIAFLQSAEKCRQINAVAGGDYQFLNSLADVFEDNWMLVFSGCSLFANLLCFPNLHREACKIVKSALTMQTTQPDKSAQAKKEMFLQLKKYFNNNPHNYHEFTNSINNRQPADTHKFISNYFQDKAPITYEGSHACRAATSFEVIAKRVSQVLSMSCASLGFKNFFDLWAICAGKYGYNKEDDFMLGLPLYIIGAMTYISLMSVATVTILHGWVDELHNYIFGRTVDCSKLQAYLEMNYSGSDQRVAKCSIGCFSESHKSIYIKAFITCLIGATPNAYQSSFLDNESLYFVFCAAASVVMVELSAFVNLSLKNTYPNTYGIADTALKSITDAAFDARGDDEGDGKRISSAVSGV